MRISSGGDNGANTGEVMSALAGEMRLQSDFLIARDARTACEWQSFSGNMPKLQNRFQFVLETFAVVGQDQTNMIDCSEVIPIPRNLTSAQIPHFPAGKTIRDVEAAVSGLLFPPSQLN